VKQAFFIVEPNQTQLVQIGDLLDAGRIRTVVDAVVPLSREPEAYDGRLPRQHRGKNRGFCLNHSIERGRIRMAQAALIETGTDLNRGAVSEISTALRQLLAAARLGLPRTTILSRMHKLGILCGKPHWKLLADSTFW